MKLGSFLRDVRKKNDLSQDEMAALMDVSQGVISKYEKNDSEPGLDFVRRFRILFGYDLVDENITNVVVRKTYDKADRRSLITNKESGPSQVPDHLLTQIEDYAKGILLSLQEIKKAPPDVFQRGTSVVPSSVQRANTLDKTKTDKMPKSK